MFVRAEGYFRDPMRNWTGYMPARTDGSGVVRIDMRSGNAEYFRLSQLPSPQDHGVELPGGEGRLITMPSRRRALTKRCPVVVESMYESRLYHRFQSRFYGEQYGQISC